MEYKIFTKIRSDKVFAIPKEVYELLEDKDHKKIYKVTIEEAK